MRRVAIVFAVLLIFLQPHSMDTPRSLIGLFGESTGSHAGTTQLHPSDNLSPPSPKQRHSARHPRVRKNY